MASSPEPVLATGVILAALIAAGVSTSLRSLRR
jgi:hypothetical protein